MIRGLMHRTRPLAVLAAFLCPATVAHAQGFGGTVADHLVRGDSLLAQGKTAEAIVQFQERSEEHTSELQSLAYLVCRLLLEKKNNKAAYRRKSHSTAPHTGPDLPHVKRSI